MARCTTLQRIGRVGSCLEIIAQWSEYWWLELETLRFMQSSHSLRVYFASLFLLSSCCQVTEYYTQVHRSLEMEPCNVINKKHKDWLRLLKIKIHYFQAMSHVSCEG